MKNFYLLLLCCLAINCTVNAQSPPQAISWQTVVRAADGGLVQNQSVSVRFDLHQTAANGTVVYSETHSGTTDEFGLLNLFLGAGTPVSGQFSTIDWGNGPYFTEVLVDPSGGSNYQTTGAQQMMSVPYALYAGAATEVDDADADPSNELQTLSISGDTLYISDGNYVLLSDFSTTDRCADGLANFDETGVDCGGSQCQSCADRCNDGVQNGDETAVDCGGSSCPTCPTCSDGIQNGDETGIDCGGSSCVDCNSTAHCSDGIQNSDETGVDCGGSLCQSCTDRCSDGIQNGDETGIDCGGSSCVGCNDIARCSDGIQNGDETGIDCGGSLCSPCSGISSCSGLPNGQLTDPRDGKVYNTVQIGNQCWMAENLNYGTMINSVNTGSSHSDQTNNGIAEKYCYGNTASNCDTYGGLYEWPELMNYASSSTSNPSGVQGLCPPGWHVPSDDEWKQLEMHLGMSQSEADQTDWRGTDEGGKLKEAGLTHWSSPNAGATNSSGFTALPGGYRDSNGNFNLRGNFGFFWSSSESGASHAYSRYLYYNYSSVRRSDDDEQDGFSCRCVKD